MPYLSALMGASFRPAEVKELIKALVVDDVLYLERDEENEYDANAIRFVNSDGVFLGFVEKEKAAEIAPLMDEGQAFDATVIGFLSTLKPHLEITESMIEDDYESEAE